MLSGYDFAASGSVVQLFALRALSHCKHDMGTLPRLNAETLEMAPTPLFGRFVRCTLLRDYGNYDSDDDMGSKVLGINHDGDDERNLLPCSVLQS